MNKKVCPGEHIIRKEDDKFESSVVTFYLECNGQVFTHLGVDPYDYKQREIDLWIEFSALKHQNEYLQKEIVKLEKIKAKYDKEHEDDHYDPMG